MSGVLVYSERDELARDLAGWAAKQHQALGPTTAAVLGEGAESRANSILAVGAGQVYFSQHAALSNPVDDVLAGTLGELAELCGADLVLIGATRRGRSLAPRLAQRLAAGCVSEALELELRDGHLVTGRLSLGGNTVAHERLLSAVKVVGVVPGTVESAVPGEPTGVLEPLPVDIPSSRAHVAERVEKPPVSADITVSERLVCIGRGLAGPEDLPLVQDLAAALGGEVACTRPLAYEYGWLPEETMIGISGARCSPQLMLSLGVSGQVQHTVGITGSKVIVAINSEPSAPIFQLADYGIVGDLYQIAPKLAEKLRQRG